MGAHSAAFMLLDGEGGGEIPTPALVSHLKKAIDVQKPDATAAVRGTRKLGAQKKKPRGPNTFGAPRPSRVLLFACVSRVACTSARSPGSVEPPGAGVAAYEEAAADCPLCIAVPTTAAQRRL